MGIWGNGDIGYGAMGIWGNDDTSSRILSRSADSYLFPHPIHERRFGGLGILAGTQFLAFQRVRVLLRLLEGSGELLFLGRWYNDPITNFVDDSSALRTTMSSSKNRTSATSVSTRPAIVLAR